MSLTLPHFGQAKVLVIGDIMLDRYWTGGTDRISPEAPVPVVRVRDIEDRLGGAANVAKNLAALGCQVSLAGFVGADQAGHSVKKLLQEAGIEDRTIALPQAPTITKLRVLSRHQQLIRMDFEDPFGANTDSDLLSQLRDCIAQMDAVIISDYAKGTVRSPQGIIAHCRQHNVPLLVDPKGHDFERYRGATYLTPNRGELEGVVGRCDSLYEAFIRAQTLAETLDARGILVTLSENGMALVRQGETPLHMPTHARDVFDVTGAGDTVIATFGACLAAGSDAQHAMRMANVAAGVVVGKLGTSSVSAQEIRDALALEDLSLSKGATSLAALQEQVKQCHQRGEKVVFTNGCFDLLHAGHVRYLKQAAELGDRLIVAMNSDASISRLKGPQRPIVTLDERMEVMASLNCVDWVIAFEDDTPQSLIDALKPDVLVKGGDYVAEKIVGYDTVKKNGGEVTVLPFVEGCSTTSIVDKIKQLS